MTSLTPEQRLRRTGIIVTIGPSSRDRKTLTRLVEAGVDHFRFNFSHSSHAKHKRALELVREVGEAAGRPMPCIQDLQGPKVRVGELGEGLELESKTKLELVGPGHELEPTRETLAIPIDYPGELPRLEPGQKIWLDEGNILLRAREVSSKNRGPASIPCKVEIGGTLLSRKAVHIPGVEMEAPILDQQDLNDLEFGLQLGFDMVAVSYVRNARDLATVRRTIETMQTEGHGTKGQTIPLITKVETASAVMNLESVARASSELWVARGDLGMEMPLERVPILQKQIVSRCHAQGKRVAIATQLLDSMIVNRRPTRAEATDVANAIFDGADALLLSGETTIGKYPARAVEWLKRLAMEAEEHPEYLLSSCRNC